MINSIPAPSNGLFKPFLLFLDGVFKPLDTKNQKLACYHELYPKTESLANISVYKGFARVSKRGEK